MIKFKYNELSLVYKKYPYILNSNTRIYISPIGIKNVPEGEYLVRGNIKGQIYLYIHVNDEWFLSYSFISDDTVKRDICIKFNLLPQLSEREWVNIIKVPDKVLNKQWLFYKQCYLDKKYSQEFELKQKLRLYKLHKKHKLI